VTSVPRAIVRLLRLPVACGLQQLLPRRERRRFAGSRARLTKVGVALREEVSRSGRQLTTYTSGKSSTPWCSLR
jgi:hypothetical protein